MKRYALLLCLALCACGSVDISYHTVTREQLDIISGARGLWGFCEWKEKFGQITEAEIYIMPRENYPTERCFQAVLRHEEDHAEKGKTHKGRHVIPECDDWMAYPD